MAGGTITATTVGAINNKTIIIITMDGGIILIKGLRETIQTIMDGVTDSKIMVGVMVTMDGDYNFELFVLFESWALKIIDIVKYFLY